MAGPDRPLSKRNLHPDCAMYQLENYLRWVHLWAFRDDPDFRERVDDFLAGWVPGYVLPGRRAA